MQRLMTDRPAAPHKLSVILRQLLRFFITGGGITLGAAVGYWLLATPAGLDPALALTIVFVIFTTLGYFLHSVISFADHGSRDRPTIRTMRYLAVNLGGFAVNQAFIWGLVTYAGGPTWWPVVPMVLVTPLLTFSLHRRWVFA
jgi:putative flippase GtrA